MFLTIRKSVIGFVCFALIVAGLAIIFGVKSTMTKPNMQKVVVIDAGHGGRDGGAVGSETDESFLNLQYALALKDVLQEFNYKVVLTRDDMGGLYSPLASNKKLSEMKKRIGIIKSVSPDLVISIHMNSFASADVRGAQVFYAQDSQSSKSLAQSIQDNLFENVDYAKKTAKAGDYYILNCSPVPSVLIECGFISNPEEEKLLLNKNYCKKFCYQVACGVFSYYRF